MRPPTTTGDDHPCPGTSIFHATFFVVLHSVGTPVEVDNPCPVGPRNWGQSSARTDDASTSEHNDSRHSERNISFFPNEILQRAAQRLGVPSHLQVSLSHWMSPAVQPLG